MHVLVHSLPTRLKTDIYINAKGKIFNRQNSVPRDQKKNTMKDFVSIYLSM